MKMKQIYVGRTKAEVVESELSTSWKSCNAAPSCSFTENVNELSGVL